MGGDLNVVAMWHDDNGWGFWAQKTGAEQVNWVPSTLIDELRNISPFIRVRGMSILFTNLDLAASISLSPYLFQSDAVYHYLDGFTIASLSTEVRSYFPLDMNMNLSVSAKPFYVVMGGVPAAMSVIEITAWGLFEKAPLQDPPPVRFASPQTVTVEGVHLWPRR